MNTISNKVAAITGAGSGIGRELALGLARRGARLAVSDVNENGLDETVEQVKAFGAQVHAARLDVSDRVAVADYATVVADHYGIVHQVYNNAGIAGASLELLDIDYAEIERILSVNFWGVVHGTKEFLPHLITSGDGHIVNISSVNGIMAQASIGAYCSSKFAVRGFTESLRIEMNEAGHPVQVTVVHPGGVKTNIASSALVDAEKTGRDISVKQRERIRTYNEKLLKMPSEKAAEIIISGVERNKSRIIVGSDARILDLVVRLVPSQYTRLAAWLDKQHFKE